MLLARHGKPDDQKVDAAVRFARKVTEFRGRVSTIDLDEVRRTGFTEGQIVDMICYTAQCFLTNHLNNVFYTEVDFLLVELTLG